MSTSIHIPYLPFLSRVLHVGRGDRFTVVTLTVLSFFVLFHLSIASEPADVQEQTKELFGDPGFANGFQIQNHSTVYGVLQLPFLEGNDFQKDDVAPVWKLAQHNSKFDLTKSKINLSANLVEAVTLGQRVALEKNDRGEFTLFLGVNAQYEYDSPRKNDEPWIHLLLVRDFQPRERVNFGNLESLVFSCDARVCDWKRLMCDDEFDSGLHTTQASFYFIILNDDPNSPDYRDYIWFGISFFDARYEIQSQYVELDGDPRTIGTGKLIYRLGEQKTIDDVMSGVNPFSKKWTHVEIDLVKYVPDMLKTAKERGILTHTSLEQLKLAHFNFGWETPGTFSSSLAIKNLRLNASTRK